LGLWSWSWSTPSSNATSPEDSKEATTFLRREQILLLIIAISVFGAGIADIVYTDVVPIRPYTSFFNTDLRLVSSQLGTSSGSGGLVGDIFGATIVIVLASSLFATVANFTTGRTLAHAGFTPNPNVTSTIGLVPIIQIIPFVFGAMVLAMTYAIFQRHIPGGL
jgi:hypothetical protein